MSDIVTIEKIGSSTGQNDGRTWTRWTLKDANGNWYSTFQEEVIAPIRGHEGQRAEIVYESVPKNGRILRNLVSAKLADQATLDSTQATYAPASPAPTNGQPDWDLIGLRKTRCALWAGTLTGVAGNMLALNKGDVGAFLRQAVTMVAAAEKDIFERPAGDDGIPF